MANLSSIRKQAWQEAIKAGKEVTESLDDTTLTNLFAGIDFHSDLFQGDQNIFNASVDLLTTVFKAVEGAIGFYISWQGTVEIRTPLNFGSTTGAWHLSPLKLISLS